MRNRAIYGWTVLAAGISYGIVETRFFGWNFQPKTSEELICDGISLILTCMALLIFSSLERKP
jgi:hypothetical protein